MKKILSILLIAFLGVTFCFADSNISITVKVASSSAGFGYVDVSNQSTFSSTFTNLNKTYTSKADGTWGQCWTHGEKTEPGYIMARVSNDNYRFLGWTCDSEDGDYISQLKDAYGPLGESHCKCDNYTFTHTYYAHFAEKETMNIVLKGVSEGGSYTADYTLNGLQKSAELSTTSGDNLISGIEDATFTLEATPATGYSFLRWRIEYEDGTIVPNNEINPDITFANSGTLYCEFISDDYAQFILKGQKNSYFKLSDAIAAAVASTVSKVIVVNQSGTLYEETESSTYFNADTKTYTIPDGITLLVPGDKAHTNRIGQITKSDFVDASNFSNYRMFIIPSGITLEFNGDLCVYATISSKMSNMAQPVSYGQIHLCDNAKIQLNTGAIANVYGYVTGIPSTTEVRIQKDATIYEIMQIRDWRGGSGTTAIIGNSQKVFPINNYYAQNVETKLVLEAGAYEYIVTGVAVSIPIVGGSETVFTDIPFVVPKDEASGFVKQADSTTVTKYYDRTNDRLVIDVTSTDASETNQLSNVVINMSGYEIDSKDYVFSFTPYMSLNLYNVTFESPNPIALLAGTSVSLDETSTLNANANVYIYDADENTITLTAATSHFAAGTYGYFASNNQRGPFTALKKPSYPSHLTTPSIGSRTVQDTHCDINGVVNGKIYTTKGGASIVSSKGTGKVTFNGLTDATVYQALQYAKTIGQGFEFSTIPITPAKLLNADNSYSAGGTYDVENSRTYIYYPLWKNENNSLGRWSHEPPQGELTATEISGHEISVTLPEAKPGDLVFTPVGYEITVNSIKSVNFGTGSFSANGESSFSGVVATIPYTYTPSTEHDATGAGSVTVEFNCKNGVSGQDEEISLTINLTATQDYTPNFNINNSETDPTALTFAATTIGQSSASQTITVNPIDGNVTDRTKNGGVGYVSWSHTTLSDTSPFRIEGSDYFSGVNVFYEPTSTSGTHTQTLTLTATYSEGVTCTKTITLTGTPSLASNPLQFVEDKEIYPNDIINQLFASTGNGRPLTFTYNEKETSEFVEIVSSVDNYELRVKSGATILTQQVITIKATQSANDVTVSGSDEIVVTITPPVQWNWSNLYFDNTYTDPVVVVNTEDAWTLTYNNSSCTAITSFSGDAANGYTAMVGNGDECEAAFTFTQGSYNVTFTANVYADPRILPMCMRDEKAERTYNGITIEKTNVEYSNGILFATTESSGAAWTMELKGFPDYMEFIPSGEGKTWTIQESSDGITWETTYTDAAITIPEGETYFKHNLKPTTKQIRIICSIGEVQGKITDLCVYSLEGSVSADAEKLYIPILRDENDAIIQSQQTVSLSYMSPESYLQLQVVDNNGDAVADITLSSTNLADGKLPATSVGDENNLFKEEVITVSSTHATDEIVYLRVMDQEGSEKLKLPIRLYTYPQSLPMRSADWTETDAEKYYFYTDFSHTQNVQFDAVTQQLTFSASTSEQRFITFAFKGGPSYISFETQTEMTLEEWYTYWTLQVSDGESVRSVADNAEAEVQPVITTEVRDETTYYQVRVAIPYTTKSLTLQSKRNATRQIQNIVIDGESDLDVVLGNHTIEHEGETNFTPDMQTQDVTVTAINLQKLKVACDNTNFTVKLGETSISNTPVTLTATDCPKALGEYMVGNITFQVTWSAANAVDEGTLIFTDASDNVLATIRLLGAQDYILQGNAANTGLYTGIATEVTSHPFQSITEENYQYQRTLVDLSNTFDANGVALFDYLIVYGETTTKEEGGTTITPPSSTAGSNAKTPYYIYRKALNDDGTSYDRYQFVHDVANANEGHKANLAEVVDAEGNPLIPHAKVENATQFFEIAADEKLSVYITGFCPYASVGYTKDQEGVWLFRGENKAKLDVYLEKCHIYSRNKTEDGHTYTGKFDPGANIFQEDYARGSGGVLVFENIRESSNTSKDAFQVTIHTRGKNLLESNHGCFYEIYGMRAYQVSSPVQVRLTSDKHVPTARAQLTFDDWWPTKLDANRLLTDSIRTNGFISLQKKANNAPSIDMGNANTVVNFRGGQVELQNAVNVSDKYKTTLAISHRSGIMAAGGIEVQMAYGIGTDDAEGGIVNFYDGTISVIPLTVSASDQQYYLMDPQLTAEGDTVRDANDNIVYTDITTCLRCPEQTYVYGGSICMLRACMSPTSKGGAPTDGKSSLGRFFYNQDHGYTYNTADGLQPADNSDAAQWLVNPTKFPEDVTLFEGLVGYYTGAGYSYGIESVTPNENGQLVLWIPDGYGGVKAEEDRYLTAWKACMTEIGAYIEAAGFEAGGTVGGNVSIENIEDVDNLLYCDLDEYVYDFINDTSMVNGDPVYNYEAPVKVPDGFQMDGMEVFGHYMRLAPTHVGDRIYEVSNEEDYNIYNQVFFIASAKADLWQTFTAPFDVANIWVVESYDEAQLEAITLTDEEKNSGLTTRRKIITAQAQHNADFASFFGVAMALGSQQTFAEIFNDYLEWAMIEDEHSGDATSYTKRGRTALIPFDGSNWRDANFYLFHNNGNWTIEDADAGEYKTQWEYTQREGNVLLKKGETYSMLFPYCTGCFENGDLESREYWDYWSGKFLIFESTQASDEKPHVIRGSNYVSATQPAEGDWVFPSAEVTTNPTEAIVTGNSTFAHMNTSRTDVYGYVPVELSEMFVPIQGETTILPSTAFLLANPPANSQGMPARRVMRTGEIIYGDNNSDDNGNQTPTGNMPTVGGGNDLFITTIANGINIAVAAPQHVRVISSTGAMLFHGMVQTAVDVPLPANGVYVITGENEVHKILY